MGTRDDVVRLRQRRLQVALGLLWLLDGALQLQPYMYEKGSNGFLGPLTQNTMGPPNLITDSIRVALTNFVAHQVLINTLIVVVQLGIGAGLLWRRSAPVALAASIPWGLAVWAIGEGVGQLLFPQTSMLTGAPGAALIYALLGVVLWPGRDSASNDMTAAAADGGLLGMGGARVAWAAVWCGTALLELESGNHAPNGISAQLGYAAGSQPSLLAHVGHWAARLTGGSGVEIAGALLIVQFSVGWLALRDRTLRAALVVGIALSCVFWVVGQNLGSILTGHGTDPSLGPVMVLFALALWPASGAGADLAWDPGPSQERSGGCHHAQGLQGVPAAGQRGGPGRGGGHRCGLRCGCDRAGEGSRHAPDRDPGEGELQLSAFRHR